MDYGDGGMLSGSVAKAGGGVVGRCRVGSWVCLRCSAGCMQYCRYAVSKDAVGSPSGLAEDIGERSAECWCFCVNVVVVFVVG